MWVWIRTYWIELVVIAIVLYAGFTVYKDRKKLEIVDNENDGNQS